MGRRAKATTSRRTQGHGGRSALQKPKKKGSYTGEDFNELMEQLKPLGLAVRKMDADGNCLFRAVADQLLGDCEEHMQVRKECCDLMLEQADELKVFHADDGSDEEAESYEDYVERMRSPGRWGSQLELMAICRRYALNAIVHQCSMPAYKMVAAPLNAPCIQLSYHDGEHYNSIRFSYDMASRNPAHCLTLQQVPGQGPPEVVEEDTPPQTAHWGCSATCAPAPEPCPRSDEEDEWGGGDWPTEASTVAGSSQLDAISEEAKPPPSRQTRLSRPQKRVERRRTKDDVRRGKDEARTRAAAEAGHHEDALSLLNKQLINV